MGTVSFSLMPPSPLLVNVRFGVTPPPLLPSLMNWSMKRKSSRPSQTSSTRPLPRCPVTKKTLYRKKPFFKYRPKNPYPIFHYTVPNRPPNFFGKLGQISSPICPNNYLTSVATHCPKNKQTNMQHTYFVFFLNFFCKQNVAGNGN